MTEVRSLQRSLIPDAEDWERHEQTFLRGIAYKAKTKPAYRFRDLSRFVDETLLSYCFHKKLNKRAASGVDDVTYVIATCDEHDIIVFQTNIGHAGEFIDELLQKRQPDQPPPILMSDALSSNKPTVMPVHHAACNSHGRRQFVDIINQFPDEVEWVLDRYKIIWDNEDEVTAKMMTAAQRLAYHQEHSLPVMNEIRDWGVEQLDTGAVEENSSLGKAIAYFNRHFDRLTLFCQIEEAKIDNNYMEAILKLIVRNRKNAYFYKTLAGAAISDVITSCIATAMQAEVNVFHYFNAVQGNSQDVKKNPMNWLPWNYIENKQITPEK